MLIENIENATNTNKVAVNILSMVGKSFFTEVLYFFGLMVAPMSSFLGKPLTGCYNNLVSTRGLDRKVTVLTF